MHPTHNDFEKFINNLPAGSEPRKRCVQALIKTCGLYGILPNARTLIAYPILVLSRAVRDLVDAIRLYVKVFRLQSFTASTIIAGLWKLPTRVAKLRTRPAERTAIWGFRKEKDIDYRVVRVVYMFSRWLNIEHDVVIVEITIWCVSHSKHSRLALTRLAYIGLPVFLIVAWRVHVIHYPRSWKTQTANSQMRGSVGDFIRVAEGP